MPEFPDTITLMVSGRQVRMDTADALLFVGVPLRVASNGYVTRGDRRRGDRRYVHRDIAGAGPAEEVDHINGDRLDNRRCNLRLCTHAENMRNTKLRRDNATSVTGVRWDRARLLWAAQISVGGKMMMLGRFKEFDDAVASRRAAERTLHGQYAASRGQQRDQG